MQRCTIEAIAYLSLTRRYCVVVSGYLCSETPLRSGFGDWSPNLKGDRLYGKEIINNTPDVFMCGTLRTVCRAHYSCAIYSDIDIRIEIAEYITPTHATLSGLLCRKAVDDVATRAMDAQYLTDVGTTWL